MIPPVLAGLDLVMSVATFLLNSVVRGYHVYKDYWEAATGEILRCREERTNIHDPFAVAIIKGDSVVGHVPQKFQSAHCFCKRRFH